MSVFDTTTRRKVAWSSIPRAALAVPLAPHYTFAMRRALLVAIPLGLLLLLARCIEPVYKYESPGAAPPGPVLRILTHDAGRGSTPRAGDRVRVDLVGTYADGSKWADGPFTYIYRDESYPGVAQPRLGARIKLEWLHDQGERPERLVPLVGERIDREGYMIRRDRGPVFIEHRLRSWCRPLKLFLMNTGLGPIEFPLGCWRYPRVSVAQMGDSRASARMDSIEAMVNAGSEPQPGSSAGNAPSAPRAKVNADSIEDLHEAAVRGLPVRVGELLRAGADPEQRDAYGMTALLRVAFEQFPGHHYYASEQAAYLAVVDTLLAHGASPRARTVKGTASPMYGPGSLVLDMTPLDYAARFCDDGMVARLIAGGADAAASTGPDAGFVGAVMAGCPEIVKMMIAGGAAVQMAREQGGTPLERLAHVSSFHEAHIEVARALLAAGADPTRAKIYLKDRLDDPGPGGFGFTNRLVAKEIHRLLR